MALFALLNLGYLAGNFVIGLLGINFLNLLLEGIKFLTDTAGFFFFSLAFFDFPDGVFDSLVTFFQKFCGFFFCLFENCLSASLNILYVVFVLGDCFLHVFFTLMDILAFVFPISLVTNNILEILVALNVFRTNDI